MVATPESNENEDFQPATRRLCPDGACIGLLDDNGRCKLCGQPGGPAAARSSADSTMDTPTTADEDLGEADEGDEAASEFADRRLCPDGACIGLLDDDGRCKVCGRHADNA